MQGDIEFPMKRRDAFVDLRTHTAGEGAAVQPVRPLDLIPQLQTRKKRNRNWELMRRAETVTYRGIPLEIQRQIEVLAGSLAVPRDDVVRALLEFALEQQHKGLLKIHPFPRAQHMTLFPMGNEIPPSIRCSEEGNQRWLKEAFPAPQKRGKLRKNLPVPLWQVRVTYRIPVALKKTVRDLAEENIVPVGEMVWYLINHSLTALHAGNLHLRPVPRQAGQTLFQDGGI